MEKIDCYTHFAVTAGLDWFEQRYGHPHPKDEFSRRRVELYEPTARVALMDSLEVDHHVLVPIPNILEAPEVRASTRDGYEGATVVNTALADVARNHAQRLSGVALLPAHDPNAAAQALSHAVEELGLLGGLVPSGPQCRALDDEAMWPIYEAAVALDVPLWVHPVHEPSVPDIQGESSSKYAFSSMFGYVTDDTLAMTRLVFGNVLRRLPKLKIIIHHCGGMVPFFAGRIESTLETRGQYDGPDRIAEFKRVFVDTALMREDAATLKLVVDFFGSDHVVFGSDAPQDGDGRRHATTADWCVRHLDAPDDVREAIYAGNARRLMRLPLANGEAGN